MAGETSPVGRSRIGTCEDRQMLEKVRGAWVVRNVSEGDQHTIATRTQAPKVRAPPRW